MPVASGEPKLAASYQFTDPALAVAPSVTIPLAQIEPGAVAVIVGTGLIVAVIAVRLKVVQPLFVASTK